MSALVKSKRACEKHLMQLDPTFPTAFEGVHFDPPSDAMYQSCQFVILRPDDVVSGTDYYRERFQFQVYVAELQGKGTTTALVKAESIRDHFSKGTSLFEDDVTIRILRTPQVAGTMPTQDRIVVPIIIELITEVFN